MIPVNLDFNRAPVLMTVFTALLRGTLERFIRFQDSTPVILAAFSCLEMLTKATHISCLLFRNTLRCVPWNS